MGGLTPEARRLVDHRAADVISIDGADEFFQSLLGKIEALDDLKGRVTTGVEVLVAEAKRYLPDPTHRIRLHDLVMDAVDRALQPIDFGGNPTGSTVPDYLAKAREVEAACANLIAVAAVISQFADRQDQRDLLRRAFSRLAGPTDVRLGGLTAWINLRGYPALLAMYAAGLTATANDNWTTLADLLAVPVNDPGLNSADNPVPFPSAFVPWRTLESAAINSTFDSPGRKTPVSDYLHDRFASALSSHLRMSEDQFAQVFDEWEYLLGVVTHDIPHRRFIGRFVWKHRYAFEDRTPDRALIAATPELLGRGFFAGVESRMTEVRQAYDEMVRQSGLHF
jgi:hypothetical protein